MKKASYVHKVERDGGRGAGFAQSLQKGMALAPDVDGGRFWRVVRLTLWEPSGVDARLPSRDTPAICRQSFFRPIEPSTMPKPVLQAMVLADHIYRDAETGKFLIIGTFGSLGVRSPPAQKADSPEQAAPKDSELAEPGRLVDAKEVRRAGSPYLYVALTGLHGPVSLRIRYVDLSDFTVMFEGKLDVVSNDPLALAEFSVPLPPLPARLPITPGQQYSLDLLHEGEILGMWRVTVKLLDASEDAGEEQDQ